MPQTKILIVDNDGDFLSARSELLTNAGYEIFSAKSGHEARALLDQNKLDLAIIDVRLADDADERDTSGIGLAQTLSEPVIMLTSYADYRLTRKAFTSADSVVDVVAKQDGISALTDAITDILQQEASHGSGKEINPRPTRLRLDLDAQLEADYNETRKQARLNHRIALTFAAGFCVIFAFALMLILMARMAEGVLLTLSSVIPAVLSGVFGWLNRDVSKRQDRYHKELMDQYDKQRASRRTNSKP